MRTIIIGLLLIGSCSVSMGQIEQGDGILSPHIGLFGDAGDPANRDFPLILLSYENMISDLISVGGLVGYESATLENTFSDDESRNRYFIAALGNIHFLQSESLDGYGTLKLGYEGSNNDVNSGSFLFDIGAGLRYFVSDSFAIMGEAGTGYSNIRVGASFVF